MTHRRNNYRTLVVRLSELIAKVHALGIDGGDRELLDCPHCGLLEDATFEGQRITCRPERLGRDTGLRFEELPRKRLRCPACRSIIRGPDAAAASADGIPKGKRRLARSTATAGRKGRVRPDHPPTPGPRDMRKPPSHMQ